MKREKVGEQRSWRVFIEPLVRLIVDPIRNSKLKKYYSLTKSKASNKRPILIYMADGKIKHGGLSDRFCGLISCYSYCKENNIEFRVFFNSPYRLEEFLSPNLIDWRISEKEISYNSKDSLPIYISNFWDFRKQRRIARQRFKNIKDYKQAHVYTNMRYFDKSQFNELFFELFKINDNINIRVNKLLESLPEKYVSVTFRFQQLLGDFEEGDFKKLGSEEEKESLIQKCLASVKHVQELNPDVAKILVTSDSKTFLNRVSGLNGVVIIPGDLVHVDFLKEKVNNDIHVKSYIDLFMLAKASKIYLANFAPLYSSSFPHTASFIYGSEFIIMDN